MFIKGVVSDYLNTLTRISSMDEIVPKIRKQLNVSTMKHSVRLLLTITVMTASKLDINIAKLLTSSIQEST